MQDFVTLSCPSCGGKLQVTHDIDRFACAHCGNEHVVRRAGGIVALTPVVDEIRQVRTGVDKTASELAIQRLSSEVRELQQKKQDIRSNPSPADLWAGFILGAGLAMSVFALFALLGSPEAGMLASMAVWIIGYLWGRHTRLQKQQNACAAIDQRIATKRQEIAKHKQIVDVS